MANSAVRPSVLSKLVVGDHCRRLKICVAVRWLAVSYAAPGVHSRILVSCGHRSLGDSITKGTRQIQFTMFN